MPNTAADQGSTAWLRRYHPGGAPRARLVCLPHAGGSASFFRPVSARFPDADVICVQYPGRQDRRREPLVDDIGRLADSVRDELAALPPLPTVLFGHSMGAVLAYETAWRLAEVGRPVGAVVASGRRAPSTVRDERVHLLSDDGIIKELRLLDGTNSTVLGDEEILRMAMPAIRNDYKAIETYRCTDGKRLSCPIVVLTGDTDPKTTAAEAEAWHAHTDAECRVHTFTGGHFFLTDHQAAINAALGAELDRVTTPGR